jgi:hypothetical protein
MVGQDYKETKAKLLPQIAQACPHLEALIFSHWDEVQIERDKCTGEIRYIDVGVESVWSERWTLEWIT